MIPLLLSVLLTGTPMGSSPSVDYSTNQATTAKNTFVSAFDGDLSTYFASYDRSNTWCGLDLGQTYIIDKVGWSPRCGELDIIELGNSNAFRSGTQDRYFNGAMHVGASWDRVWSDAQAKTWPYSVEDTFHIVTCEWTPDSVKIYMDKDSHPENGPYFATRLEDNEDPAYNHKEVWSKPSFLILNLAIGGNFTGIFDVESITALKNGPAQMFVDWIRVYQIENEVK